METISNFFAAIAAMFSWRTKKLDADNTPEMKARAAGQTDQEIKDGAAKSVAAGDLDQIRKDLAE